MPPFMPPAYPPYPPFPYPAPLHPAQSMPNLPQFDQPWRQPYYPNNYPNKTASLQNISEEPHPPTGGQNGIHGYPNVSLRGKSTSQQHVRPSVPLRQSQSLLRSQSSTELAHGSHSDHCNIMNKSNDENVVLNNSTHDGNNFYDYENADEGENGEFFVEGMLDSRGLVQENVDIYTPDSAHVQDFDEFATEPVDSEIMCDRIALVYGRLGDLPVPPKKQKVLSYAAKRDPMKEEKPIDSFPPSLYVLDNLKNFRDNFTKTELDIIDDSGKPSGNTVAPLPSKKSVKALVKPPMRSTQFKIHTPVYPAFVQKDGDIDKLHKNLPDQKNMSISFSQLQNLQAANSYALDAASHVDYFISAAKDTVYDVMEKLENLSISDEAYQSMYDDLDESYQYLCAVGQANEFIVKKNVYGFAGISAHLREECLRNCKHLSSDNHQRLKNQPLNSSALFNGKVKSTMEDQSKDNNSQLVTHLLTRQRSTFANSFHSRSRNRGFSGFRGFRNRGGFQRGSRGRGGFSRGRSFSRNFSSNRGRPFVRPFNRGRGRGNQSHSPSNQKTTTSN